MAWTFFACCHTTFFVSRSIQVIVLSLVWRWLAPTSHNFELFEIRLIGYRWDAHPSGDFRHIYLMVTCRGQRYDNDMRGKASVRIKYTSLCIPASTPTKRTPLDWFITPFFILIWVSVERRIISPRYHSIRSHINKYSTTSSSTLAMSSTVWLSLPTTLQ